MKPYMVNRYEILSAGISAYPGSTATMPIVDILAENEDIDITNHRSRRLDRYMILSSDLIFTMEDIQEKYILQFEPTAQGRVFNIKKFLPWELENDIPDPIARDRAFYDNVYNLLKQAVEELVDWL